MNFDIAFIKELRKQFSDNITAIYCLVVAYKCVTEQSYDEAKKYFDFINTHLYSQIKGKHVIRLYLDVKEGLGE